MQAMPQQWQNKKRLMNVQNNNVKRISNKYRPMHSRGLMLRAMMLLVLPLSLASCSSKSEISVSGSSTIPELSPLAIQPPVPEFCFQGCSASLSKEIERWQITLTGQENQE